MARFRMTGGADAARPFDMQRPLLGFVLLAALWFASCGDARAIVCHPSRPSSPSGPPDSDDCTNVQGFHDALARSALLLDTTSGLVLAICRNNPVDETDPLGLWILMAQRSDLRYREVVAEEDGESIEKLVTKLEGSGLHLLGKEAFARREYAKVKLPKPSLGNLPPGMSPAVGFEVEDTDSRDQGGWLRHADGAPAKHLGEIKKGQTYRVPNTFLVSLGDVNALNLTSITTADDIAKAYGQKGFFVLQLPYQMKRARGLMFGQGTEGNNIGAINEALGRHDIAGWAHAGHGFQDPVTKKTPGSLIILLGYEETGVFESDFQLHHHLSEVVLYVCYAAKNQRWLDMVTPGGLIRFTDKKLGTLPGPSFGPWTDLPTYRRRKQ
jgi:hypothetical protein